MGYEGKILARALERLEQEKQRRGREHQAKVDWACRQDPRIGEITRQLQQTMGKIMADALRSGGDPRTAVRRLEQENLELQRERARRLKALGCPEDLFEEKPACLRCRDTGYVSGGMCRCLQRLYAQEQIRELSRTLDLGEQSFDTFSFDWYSQQVDPAVGISPRENMELLYEICSDYAHSCTQHSRNLLLYGAPGLGKTFLSACIAREASEQGCSVVYDSAGHVFSQMEKSKFGREDGQETGEEVGRYFSADLLILDDLGTEMNTSFVLSALYQLLNTRLMEGKKTIINTNLTPEELKKRYGASVASRLEGEYKVLPFFGQDIRIQKRNLK